MCAVTGAYVTGVNRIALAPAIPIFHVAHTVDGMVIQGAGAGKTTQFTSNNLFSDLTNIFVLGH